MLELLRRLILDFQESRPATGVPRRLRIETVPGKATVCIGVRRSGKSTYLFQVMEDLVRQGVARENILYMNFFDDRLHALRREDLASVVDAYFSLFPGKKGIETVYCFFDEIQGVSGWEPFVDRLLRTEKCQVYLTGSSARMLSREVATQMRGRALSWEVFPFSFAEFLDARGVEWEGPLSTRKQLIVRRAFEEYWTVGGFPEVVAQGDAGSGTTTAMPARLRIKTHQEYFQAILFRDLVERHDAAHPRALGDLAHRLIDNTASLYSATRLTGALKALGHSVARSTVSDYLQWFEDAYFLFTVQVFDPSIARRNTNPKKVYCVDHSLVSSVSSGVLLNTGHLLENLVFTALRRHFTDIHYYRTKSDREVDFVVGGRGRSLRLVQVSESLIQPQTRKRELSALWDAMAELGLKSGTVVTRAEAETIQGESGTIQVIPTWQFLLELGGSGE